MAGLAIGLPLDTRRRVILDARVMGGFGSFAASPIVPKISSTSSTTTNTTAMIYTTTGTNNGTKGTPTNAIYKTSATASNINSMLSLMYCF